MHIIKKKRVKIRKLKKNTYQGLNTVEEEQVTSMKEKKLSQRDSKLREKKTERNSSIDSHFKSNNLQKQKSEHTDVEKIKRKKD